MGFGNRGHTCYNGGTVGKESAVVVVLSVMDAQGMGNERGWEDFSLIGNACIRRKRAEIKGIRPRENHCHGFDDGG